MTYKVRVGAFNETHKNKDDVIIALVALIEGYNIVAGVEWPDGFTTGVLE